MYVLNRANVSVKNERIKIEKKIDFLMTCFELFTFLDEQKTSKSHFLIANTKKRKKKTMF